MTRPSADRAARQRLLGEVAAAVCLLAGGFAPVALGGDKAHTIFYVSPQGSDANAGGREAPFQTVARAQRAVRSSERAGRLVEVRLADGVHVLEAPLRFAAADGGGANGRVVYRAAPGARPVLSGGATVGPWTVADSARNVWSAPIPAGLAFRQFFVDDARAVRARSPAGLPPQARKTSAGYRVPAEALPLGSWRRWQDVEFVYRVEWREPRCFVAAVDGDAITMANPGWRWGVAWSARSGTKAFDLNMPAYLENAYELLDEAGEWYADYDRGVVFYKPLPRQDMTRAIAIAPRLTRLVEICGTPAARVARLEFRGLAFAHAGEAPLDRGRGYPAVFAMVTGEPAGDDGAPGPKLQAEAAISVAHADDLTFRNCAFVRLGGSAVELRRACRGVRLERNEFTDVGGSAIQVGEFDRPRVERSRDAVCGTVIAENLIRRIGCEHRDAPAVTVFYAVDCTIRHNDLHQLPYSAIALGWGWGGVERDGGPTLTSGIVVENNHIHDFLQVMNDGAGVYACGSQRGLIIRGNHIHGAGSPISPGLYLDRGSQFATAYNNLIHDTECNMMLKGTSHDVRHNFWHTEHSLRRPAPSHFVFWGVDDLEWQVAGNSTLQDPTTYPASIIASAGRVRRQRRLAATARLDRTAPQPPQDLCCPRQTDVTADLAWSPGADDVDVTGYEVWQDRRLVAVAPAHRRRVTGLSAATAYEFTVRARDRTGNLSQPSQPLRVRTRATSGNLAANRPVYGFHDRPSANKQNPGNHLVFIRQATGHALANAVDGDPDTYALPAEGSDPEWIFQVDLGRRYALDELTMRFPEASRTGPALHATRFVVLTSDNIAAEKWTEAAAATNDDVRECTADLRGAAGRHVRIHAFQPNGPCASGTTMALAEVELRAAEDAPRERKADLAGVP